MVLVLLSGADFLHTNHKIKINVTREGGRERGGEEGGGGKEGGREGGRMDEVFTCTCTLLLHWFG